MSTEDEDAADVERERDYWLGKLADIPAKRAQAEADERETVRQARLAGVTWHQVAEALGIRSWLLAKDKYGEPEGDPF